MKFTRTVQEAKSKSNTLSLTSTIQGKIEYFKDTEKQNSYKFTEFRNYEGQFQVIFYDYIANDNDIKPCAMFWKGSSKKMSSYSFTSAFRRETYIQERLAEIFKNIKSKQEWQERKKINKIKNFNECQIGDIFYYTFGYNMTFVEFYQVVGKKGTSTVLLKEIETIIESGDAGYSGYKRPLYNEFVSDEVIKAVSSNYGLSFNGKSLSKTSKDSSHYFNSMD
jgi:hypothetical protein